MFGFKRRAAERASKRTAELNARYQSGQEAGEKAADAIDAWMGRLVKPWADTMIGTFTQRVAVKVIFCDEDPEREARSSLAEFNKAADDHLGQIGPDVRAKLSAVEQFSREMNAHDAFESLLKNRFDSLRLDLTTKAVEIASCVIIARREEMGLEVAAGEHLTTGQKILKDARATRVSLTEDQKQFLNTCLDAIEKPRA